jgi:hypothetical protein
MNARFSVEQFAGVVFRHRWLIVVAFAIATAYMLSTAARTRVDAGLTKRLPIQHEYIQTYLQYQDEFGGANRILIAFTVEQGDIFNAKFFELLRRATDEAYFIPGVDRAQVTSIWTPNVRFTEIVEDGFSGGNVVPANFAGTDADLARVRENVIKSGRVGQLVANDFSGAIISAQLQEVDPATGERLDYIRVARHLEEHFRTPYERAGRDIDLQVHIIGFAKVIGDISAGAVNVIFFFIISLFITAVCVYVYAQSFRLTVLPLVVALISVVWQMGLLHLMGYGIDPMSILVPFLILAISVSHGVQMVRSFRAIYFSGHSSVEAARASFIQLLAPGATALVTDLIGFITILAIRIPVIQELAVTASIGVFTLFFTNLLLLPLLLSFIRLRPELRDKINARRDRTNRFWTAVAGVAHPGWSILVIVLGGLLGVVGFRYAMQVKIGDLNHGVPELRESSRYNRDSAQISDHFNIGVNIITVICETVPNGCIDYRVMEQIDRLTWHLRNVEGVQSVVALATMAKVINQGFNEGSPRWHILPRHPAVLGQAISPIDTASGLLNADGSVLPIHVFLDDHKAETIARVVRTVKDFRVAEQSDLVEFRLASGNVGVMGATNEVVAAAQFPMLVYVFGAVIALCFVAFRDWRAAFCIVIPLAVVSILAYALMERMQIGLKVSTLPVVALGVGVGVDYGIYLFFRLRAYLLRGDYFEEALGAALRQTGSAVVFTGITLAVGVSTWIFSALKFQADMGLLLTFMFFFNMLGAIVLLPAIARWLYRHHTRNG